MPAILTSLAVAALAVATVASKPASGFYDFKMKTLDGKEIPLSKYKGEVLLVVNVASYCGNTPQYKPLEKLYTDLHPKGFEVLGFPANQFGAQEPGSDKEIKEFCEKTYQVNFPMFSKIVVKGEGEHPLYQWLIANGPRHDDIEWNFAKFLIGRDGRIIARFGPRVQPDSPEVMDAINTALAESK